MVYIHRTSTNSKIDIQLILVDVKVVFFFNSGKKGNKYKL